MAIKQQKTLQNFDAIDSRYKSGDVINSVSLQAFKNTLQRLITNFQGLTGQLLHSEKLINNSLIDFNRRYNEEFINNHSYGLPGVIVPYSMGYLIDNTLDLTKFNNPVITGTNSEDDLKDSGEVFVPIFEIEDLQVGVEVSMFFKMVITEKTNGDAKVSKPYYIRIRGGNDIAKNIDSNSNDFELQLFPQFIEDGTTMLQALNNLTLAIRDEDLIAYGMDDTDSDFRAPLSDDYQFMLVRSERKDEPDQASFKFMLIRPKRMINNLEISLESVYAFEKVDRTLHPLFSSTYISFFGDPDGCTTIDQLSDVDDTELYLRYEYELPEETDNEFLNIYEVGQEYSSFSFSDDTSNRIYLLTSDETILDLNTINVKDNRELMGSSHVLVASHMLSDMLDIDNIDAVRFREFYFASRSGKFPTTNPTGKISRRSPYMRRYKNGY